MSSSANLRSRVEKPIHNNLDIHRLLPQDPAAEKGFLGSCLLAPKDMIPRIVEQGIGPELFHIPAHMTIFSSILDLWVSQKPIDFITLTAHMRDAGTLEICGGAALITDLFTFVPTAANAGYYTEILQEKFQLRRIIVGCTDLVGRAYDEQNELQGILDSAQALLLELTTDTKSDAKRKTMKDHLHASWERLMSIIEGGKSAGLTTGLKDFDYKLGGVHDGEVMVISGGGGGGKTALSFGIADHVAMVLKLPVQIFSYEMPARAATDRLICARGKINTMHMRTGRMSQEDVANYQKAHQELQDAPIFIEDNADMSVQQMRACARRQMSKTGLALIIVDYVQKVKSDTTKRNSSRQRDVAEVSDQIQKMAMELNIPVIALSQLNAEGEVREATDIAFDAKTVIKINRVDEKVSVEDEDDNVERILRITKNNNGPTGRVYVTFMKPFVKFVDRAKEGQNYDY